jgi:hypothetical protein
VLLWGKAGAWLRFPPSAFLSVFQKRVPSGPRYQVSAETARP